MTATMIKVIGLIDTTHEGPAAENSRGEEQAVHLMQGDLDGACGPYCLLMALLTLGIVDRDNLLDWDLRGSRRGLAKLLQLTEQYGPFFHNGTNLDDLKELVQRSFGRELGVSVHNGSGTEIRKFVVDNIEENHPVVLGIDFPDGAHWVLVIGLEHAVDDEGTQTLSRFLVLDPKDPAPKVSAWNGVIDARGSGGPYPYTWWTGEDRKVKFSAAMAVWGTK